MSFTLNSKTKILYLYSEVMGYTLAVIKELIVSHSCEVHLVYWDKAKNSLFLIDENTPGLHLYPRSKLSKEGLWALANEISPVLIYVSGRMDSGYLYIAQAFKKRSIPVVSGFDAQWKPSLKNRLLCLLSSFTYHRYFTHIWVPGPCQYEFARKLGFAPQCILLNLLSADVSLFSGVMPSFAYRFIFVGRFHPVKGLDILIPAFKSFQKNHQDWELHLIGNGPLLNEISRSEGIIVHDFMQPLDLAEFLKGGGVFVLPSRREPWGVVIHEFASAGFPMIISDACGAAKVFLKQGFNGYMFKSESVSSLLNVMQKMAKVDYSSFLAFQKASKLLGAQISPTHSCAELLSVLD